MNRAAAAVPGVVANDADRAAAHAGGREPARKLRGIVGNTDRGCVRLTGCSALRMRIVADLRTSGAGPCQLIPGCLMGYSGSDCLPEAGPGIPESPGRYGTRHSCFEESLTWVTKRLPLPQAHKLPWPLSSHCWNRAWRCGSPWQAPQTSADRLMRGSPATPPWAGLLGPTVASC